MLIHLISINNLSFFYLQGLEHLMHNLGLGQLEFEPSHTIDKHHPTGTTNYDANGEAVKSYMEQQTNKLLSDDNDDDDMQITQDISEKQQTPDNTVHHEHTSSQHDNSNAPLKTADNTVIVEFKEMHDPKHRHPRENGE